MIGSQGEKRYEKCSGRTPPALASAFVVRSDLPLGITTPGTVHWGWSASWRDFPWSAYLFSSPHPTFFARRCRPTLHAFLPFVLLSPALYRADGWSCRTV